MHRCWLFVGVVPPLASSGPSLLPLLPLRRFPDSLSPPPSSLFSYPFPLPLSPHPSPRAHSGRRFLLPVLGALFCFTLGNTSSGRRGVLPQKFLATCRRHLMPRAGWQCLVFSLSRSLFLCVFIKLHITAQSGPVTLIILCHSHWSSQGGIDNVCVCALSF